MAWYRAGGGGIPSSLKTGMNNVLNKKFGTSTTYDPAGWPDNVNLLGPLPEKTVSGAIASFADGADDVSLKKCEVNIEPNLDGVSSVGVVHGGTNLFTGNIVNLAYTSSGINQGPNYKSFYIPVTEGSTYTITRRNKEGTRFRAYATIQEPASGVMCYVLDATHDNAMSMTVTIPTGYNWLFVYLDNAGNSCTASNYLITYSAPVTHTAQLGRTIYGGSVDVVNGTGTDENGNDFTFTPVPINSFLGDNNIWADTGDTSVTYRADIALALGGG